MMDPLKMILQQSELKTTAFPVTSRYHGLGTETKKADNGDTIVYVKRRIVPKPERFSMIREHSVLQDDRTDNIANKYLSDPLQFWRICDANGVLHPDEMTDTPGKRIRITLPEGIPGNNNA
jgi:hypothetical protein